MSALKVAGKALKSASSFIKNTVKDMKDKFIPAAEKAVKDFGKLVENTAGDLKNVNLPMEDFALPGMEISDALEADHIVSMKNIVCMDGFDKLSYEQQVAVLNYKENFIGLSKVANTSKGSKSYEEWLLYKKGNIKVNPAFREKMIAIEKELEIKIQMLIDDLLKK